MIDIQEYLYSRQHSLRLCNKKIIKAEKYNIESGYLGGFGYQYGVHAPKYIAQSLEEGGIFRP